MEYHQQRFARTLPKNFTFPSTSAEEPTTPHRASIHLDVSPAPARPSTSHLPRSRARSGTDLFTQTKSNFSSWNHNHSDIPLPSIEIPPASHDTASAPSRAIQTGPTDNDRFLAPPRDRTGLKTPPAQIRVTPVENSAGAWSGWDQQRANTMGEAIERPSSSCSHASDSSVSSVKTFASRFSLEGSCTSTESDHQDPVFYLELPPKPVLEAPPPLPEQNVTKRRRREAPRNKDCWTVEMDSHLWNTYQLYLQNPTITPFKMTPGSIPPLGVTHRVAREAKKTWDRRTFKLNRDLTSGGVAQQPHDGNTTPKAMASKKPGWPRSETSTRQRLKLLCRRKFSIAPHYQRLMMSKSPGPLESSSPESLEAAHTSSEAFATRDLGVSLVSSSVPEPLSRLAAEDPLQDTQVDFNYPVYEPGSPKEKSTRADPVAKRSLGLDRPAMGPRLGSPFTYHTWGPERSKRQTRRHSPMGRGRRETIHVTGHRLRSPPRMDLFSSISNSQHSQDSSQETSESDTYSHLEDIARQGKLNDAGNRRVRIRNRGMTTSAVNSRAIHQLFSPPPSSSANQSTTPRGNPPMSHHRRNSSGESVKRLGSPFKMETTRRPETSSGRIVRHAPSSSDPFALGQFPDLKPLSPKEPVQSYDPAEPGLFDAERHNMPYSRR